MSQQTLHAKLVDCAKRNKNTLHFMVQQLISRRKQLKQLQTNRYQEYRTQYEELLKLNKESEEESFRLKKQLAMIDLQIEELSFRNQLSRSRIKDQNEQIQTIKDQTQDIDRQKRKQNLLLKENEELKKIVQSLQNDVEQMEQKFNRKRKNNNEIEQSLRQKQMRKEAMLRQHAQKELLKKQQIESLQQELRTLINEVKQLNFKKEKQQKTKRNSRGLQTVNYVKKLLQQHKSTYSNDYLD